MSCNSNESPGMEQKCTEVTTEWSGMNKMSRGLKCQNVQDYQRIVLDYGYRKCPGLKPHCTGLPETHTRTRNSETF